MSIKLTMRSDCPELMPTCRLRGVVVLLRHSRLQGGHTRQVVGRWRRRIVSIHNKVDPKEHESNPMEIHPDTTGTWQNIITLL